MNKILTLVAISVMTLSPCLGANKTVTEKLKETEKQSNPFSNHTDGIRLSMGLSVLNYSKAKSDTSEVDLNKSSNQYVEAVSTHAPFELKVEKSFSINHRFSTSTAIRYATGSSETETGNSSSYRNYKLETEYNEYGLEQRIHLNLGNGPRFRPYLGFQVGMTSIRTEQRDTNFYEELNGIHTNIKTGGELCWKSGMYIDTNISYSTLAINEIKTHRGSTKETNGLKFTGVNLGFNVGFAF